MLYAIKITSLDRYNLQEKVKEYILYLISNNRPSSEAYLTCLDTALKENKNFNYHDKIRIKQYFMLQSLLIEVDKVKLRHLEQTYNCKNYKKQIERLEIVEKAYGVFGYSDVSIKKIREYRRSIEKMLNVMTNIIGGCSHKSSRDNNTAY